MISAVRKALQTLVDLRIEAAIGRLKKNPHYMEICDIQEATEAKLEKVFRDSEGKEQISIDCYFENQSIKDGLEYNEIYYQGLKDGIQLLKLLGVIKQEESL